MHKHQPSKPPANYYDIKYIDNDGNPQIVEVKGYSQAQATSEFRYIYKGLHKSISRVKQRTDPHVPVLE